MKRKVSDILYVIVLFICGYLLIANMLHIVYLNQSAVFDYGSEMMDEVREEIISLNANVVRLNNLDAKVYSETDLAELKELYDKIQASIAADEFVNLIDDKRFYLKDFKEYDDSKTLNILPGVQVSKILGTYDNALNTYYTAYVSNVLANAFQSDTEVGNAYKYNTVDLGNQFLITGDFYNRLRARIFALEAYIASANYLCERAIEIGGGSDEE